jgi:hypothetical protein
LFCEELSVLKPFCLQRPHALLTFLSQIAWGKRGNISFPLLGINCVLFSFISD